MSLGFVLLSRNPHSYSVRRLISTAAKRGHKAVAADPHNFTLSLDSRRLLVEGQVDLTQFDIVMPRLGSQITDYSLLTLKHLELLGKVTINRAEAVSMCRNKFWVLQYLAESGLKVPLTIMVKDSAQIKDAVGTLGGFPIVVKFIRGTQGLGVMLLESMQSAVSLYDAMNAMQCDLLMQKYVKESSGTDVRIIMIGDEIVMAMRRTSCNGDFRSNIHRGGIGTPYPTTDDLARLARKVMKIVGLDIAGIDVIESKEGFMVVEVNSSPGLEGIEKYTKRDIAKEIIDYAVAKYKEMADRPRLVRA